MRGLQAIYESLTKTNLGLRQPWSMKIQIPILAVVLQFCLAAFTASAHPSSGIVVDGQGNVFFSDLSRGLLKVDPQGKVTTISKEGGHWLTLDSQGSFSKVEF